MCLLIFLLLCCWEHTWSRFVEKFSFWTHSSHLGSVVQDALLDKHIAADTFSHQQEQNIGRPMQSLAVSLSKHSLVFIHKKLKKVSSSFLAGGSIMGLHTNSRSNEILALVKSLFLMERHGVISAWSRYNHSLYAYPYPLLTVRAFYPSQAK